MSKSNWTRDELILAYNLYCKTPFGRIHTHNPAIIELAKLIGRTPSAVSWKLANFASLDPVLKDRDISGATHSSKLDLEIWDEFKDDWTQLSYESEKLLANLVGKPIEEISEIETGDLPEGKEREGIVKIRVNQSFFRKAVLAAYGSSCCVTGLNIPELLNASHIVPWSRNTENRVNPTNGICLNALHDRAFDRGLITITPEYKIRVSPTINRSENDDMTQKFLWQYDGISIRLPSRFKPEKEFLTFHNDNVFKK